MASQFYKITRQVLRAVSRSLDNKTKAEGSTVAKLLKSESTLSEIKAELSSFLESVFDGEIDAAHEKLIFFES